MVNETAFVPDEFYSSHTIIPDAFDSKTPSLVLSFSTSHVLIVHSYFLISALICELHHKIGVLDRHLLSLARHGYAVKNLRICCNLMTISALYLTVINGWIGFSFYVEHSPGTAINSCKCMINENIISGVINLEFNHDRPACRNQCGL